MEPTIELYAATCRVVARDHQRLREYRNADAQACNAAILTREDGAGVCARERGGVNVPLTHGWCCGNPKTKNAKADKENTKETHAAEKDAKEETGTQNEPPGVPRAAEDEGESQQLNECEDVRN